MRTRAYRPEVPGCLEDRSLLSGVAGLSADPVVLPHRRFNLVAEHMRRALSCLPGTAMFPSFAMTLMTSP